MVLKTYNGFDHDARMKGYNWLKGEIAAGRRQVPTECEACGQTEGKIAGHSEDYSEPFGDHIGKYALCERCHLAIHTRFKNPEAWAIYKQHIREGRTFAPVTSFQAFCGQTLNAKGKNVPFKQGPTRERTFLDELQ